MPSEAFALIILWSAREPERVGEVALLPVQACTWVLGRAQEHDDGSARDAYSDDPYEEAGDDGVLSDGSPGEPVRFFQQHPEESHGGVRRFNKPRPVQGESISRRQLEFSKHSEGLLVRNVGRCQLSVNGQTVERALISPGDTLYLSGQLLLYCTKRPYFLPPLSAYPRDRVGPFGQPDAEAMIGESRPMWALRERVAACARSNFHVLIIGESGTGKELVARAVHSLSSRAPKKLVADNIATIPPGLAAALLFGNRKNFPNPGMEEHIGLIGAANGSTLFLDEIGDMPDEVQPMFLRVAERGGEYFRLGEKHQLQRSDFRLVGATNHPEKMRFELKRRFEREIRVPSINERKEDIPLLVQHLLHQQAQQHDGSILRFLDEGNYGRPRVHPRLVEQLVHHVYTTNVSEIGFLLGQAMAESPGNIIRALRGGLPTPASSSSQQSALPPVAEVSPPEPRVKRPAAAPLPAPPEAQRTLDEHAGNVSRAAAALGISRDQLNRMIQRERLVLRRVRPRLTSSSEGTNEL